MIFLWFYSFGIISLITLIEGTLSPHENGNEADEGESSGNTEDEGMCFSV